MMARGAQALDEVQPVKTGYHPIDNQQIETITHRANEAFGAACHLGDQVAFFVKAVRDVISVLSVVLNQQDLQAAARFPASVPHSTSRDTINVIFKMSSYKIPM